MLSAVLLIAISPCQAQEVVASRENDRAISPTACTTPAWSTTKAR